jgi:hypothetical protein
MTTRQGPRIGRGSEAGFSLAFELLRRARGGFGNLVDALSHRNYRVYICGNGISLIGSWLQRVSVGWLTWTLTLAKFRCSTL